MHLKNCFIPQVNHKFPSEGVNTAFCSLTSPRFGLHCCCLRSLRPISRGEEIFVDYGYDKIGNEKWPGWYKESHPDLTGT